MADSDSDGGGGELADEIKRINSQSTGYHSRLQQKLGVEGKYNLMFKEKNIIKFLQNDISFFSLYIITDVHLYSI